MDLSGKQKEKLQKALISAFSTRNRLERMLDFKLDKNLDTVAGGNNLEDIVFDLIKTATSEDWIEDLIKAARNSNPTNPKLKAIARELLSEIPPTPNPPRPGVPNLYPPPRETPPNSIKTLTIQRREFLKWAGFGGLGLVGTIFVIPKFFDLFWNSQLQTFQFETVTVDEQGTRTNSSKGEAKYFVENLGNSLTLEMVRIPGGTFTMGSPAGEAKRQDREGPQHQVKVPEFFMGKYPVTQAQYQQVTGKNPSYFKGTNRPVERVSWNDAVEFCKKLSKITGLTYRLPSEAEWEYACRAGTTKPFHFGETITTDLVNYNGNYTYASGPKGKFRQQTIDVENFFPNSFGLYQMHGNVLEWCLDTWHDNYQGAPSDGSSWIGSSMQSVHFSNWKEIEKFYNLDNNYRMLRGGSWYNAPRNCRSANRNGFAQDDRNNYVGFRVVVSG